MMVRAATHDVCFLLNIHEKTMEKLSKVSLCAHELLKGTPLDEYNNVVTTLFQDAGENNVDASGEDMVSSITSILQTEFMD
jgi:hypothetical protein